MVAETTLEADGPNDGAAVHLPGHQRKVLGNEYLRGRGTDGGEFAAYFRRLVRLGIQGVEVAHAAVEENEDARIGTGRPLRRRDCPQPQEIPQRQAGRGERAVPQELAA